MYLFVYFQCYASPEYDFKCRNKQGLCVCVLVMEPRYLLWFRLPRLPYFFTCFYIYARAIIKLDYHKCISTNRFMLHSSNTFTVVLSWWWLSYRIRYIHRFILNTRSLFINKSQLCPLIHKGYLGFVSKTRQGATHFSFIDCYLTFVCVCVCVCVCVHHK